MSQTCTCVPIAPTGSTGPTGFTGSTGPTGPPIQTLKPPANPVSSLYKNYAFPVPELPILTFTSYEDLLKASKTITTPTILLNTVPQSVKDFTLTINLTSPLYLILNLTMTGASTAKLTGSNFAVCNLSILGGDSSKTISPYVMEVAGPSIKLINFTLKDYKVKNADKDYIRINQSAKNFELHNSLLDGKTVNGVFLRLDFPSHHIIRQCIFLNFKQPSAGNGGEMIRMATSNFERQEANCLIDHCYFERCDGDPEVVSVKCSKNTISNCIFKNNKGRLVLRHTHGDIISNNYFDGSGMRVYGSNHQIVKNQVLNKATILLDNKSGSSYVVAQDILVDTVFWSPTLPAVENKGKNNKVINIIEGIKITEKDLHTA